MTDLPTADIEVVKNKLAAADVAFVAKRDGVPQAVVYFSCSTITNASFLVEIKFKAGLNIVKLTIKSPAKPLSELCKVALTKVLLA